METEQVYCSVKGKNEMVGVCWVHINDKENLVSVVNLFNDRKLNCPVRNQDFNNQNNNILLTADKQGEQASRATEKENSQKKVYSLSCLTLFKSRLT